MKHQGIVVVAAFLLAACSGSDHPSPASSNSGSSSSSGAGSSSSSGSGAGSSSSSSGAVSSAALQTFQRLQQSGALPVLDVTSSVGGTDADGNGVRDDIDLYIAGLPDSTAQKAALTQLAGAIQATLTVNVSDSGALASTSSALNRGAACVWQSYTSGQSDKALRLEQFTINTLVRLQAYESYNAARGGAVIQLATGSVCGATPS